MAEVGVWMGKNAFALLSKRSDLEMWLIDRWKRPDADDSYATSGAEMAVKPQEKFDDAYHMAVTVAQGFKGRTHIVMDDTAHAATQFEDGSFDCVFIDADHSYEGCRRDILAWRSKVRPGGLLCGHDYANKAGEVKRAVDEIFPAGVAVGSDHTWFVRV
jgi:hypothetical protein